MFLYNFVIVSNGNERRPEVIFNGRRLLPSPSLRDHLHYLAVFINFHAGSEEVLLNLGVDDSYQCSCRMEIIYNPNVTKFFLFLKEYFLCDIIYIEHFTWNIWIFEFWII